MLDELRAAEADKAEKERKVKEEDREMTDEVEEKSKTKEKEKENGKLRHDTRDWKRNGLLHLKRIRVSRPRFLWYFLDERWLEWLDSKVALLINRSGVDPRAYGGKSYEE